MSRQAFNRGEGADVRGLLLESRWSERQHARPAEKVVGGQATGEAGRTPGRQHVRRPRDVIAQRDRGVMANEDRPGVIDGVDQSLGLPGLNMEMLGG